MAREQTDSAPSAATAMLARVALSKLDDIVQLLRSLDDSAPHVAFGAAGMQERLDNWPVAGDTRIIVPSRGQGSDNLALPANAYTDILQVDAGRGGLTLVNVGANPAFIYLARAGDAQQGGQAAGWLGANGGDWDGKISGELWCGAISARSVLGTTLVLGVI